MHSQNTFTHAGLTLTLPVLPEDARLTDYLWDADLADKLDSDLDELTAQLADEFMEPLTLEVVKPLQRGDERRQYPRTGIVLITVANKAGEVMAGFVAVTPDSYCDTDYRLTELDEWNFARSND